MFKVVVTGATGFIGKALCEKLLEHGSFVLGIGRNKEVINELEKNVRFKGLSLDYKDYEKIDQLIKDRDFDYFFHLANYGVNGADKENYRIQLTNTRIACDMIEIANNLGCRRFVFIGSVDEFEACYRPDDKYTSPTHSRIYGTAKYSAECIGKVIAERYGLEYVTALLTLTYGEGNMTNILPNMMIRNSFSGRAINLIQGNNTYDIIYITEAVEGILAVAEKGHSMESYYVGHKELRTFRDIVEDINRCLKKPIQLNFGSYRDHGLPIRYEDINRDKLKNDTGYECRISIREGITNTYNWINSIYNNGVVE